MATVEDLRAALERKRQQPQPAPQSVGGAIMSAAEGVGDAIGGAADATWDFLTGQSEKEFQDVPDVTDTLWKMRLRQMNENARNYLAEPARPEEKGVANALLGTTFSLEQPEREQVIRQNMPGAVFGTDRPYGNPMVAFPDQPGEPIAYLNQPGLSNADAANLGAGALLGNPIAKGLAPAVKMLGGGWVPRILGGGVLGGGTEAGMTAAANQQGAETGFDPARTGTAAAFGAVGEPAMSALTAMGRKLYRMIRGNPQIVQNGQLTPEGVRAAIAAGVPEGQVDAEFAKAYARLRGKLETPEQRGVYAEAQSLPEPVDLTRGQVTQRAADQRYESSLRKGDFGPEAADEAVQFAGRQSGQLQRNVDLIRNRLYGADAPVDGNDLSTVGGRVQSRLDEINATLKERENELFDVARAAKAFVPQEDTARLFMGARDDLVQDFNLRNVPQVGNHLRDLGEIVTKAGRVTGEEPAVFFRDLEAWRRQVTTTARTSSDPSIRAAASRLRESYDKWADQMVDEAKLIGDQDAVMAWKAARNATRERKELFEAKDLVQQLSDGTLDPAAVTRKLFAASATSLGGRRPRIASEMRKVRRLLGRDSEEWRAVKDEAFLRFVRAGTNTSDNRTYEFSGVKFGKAWNQALQDNPEMMGVLFTPDEKMLIAKFGRVMDRVTRTVEGGANYSNTGHTNLDTLTRALAALGIGENMVGRILGAFRPTAQLLARPGARGRLQAIPATPTPFGPGGIYGGVGGPPLLDSVISD
ncbi:hypothetical protein ACFOGJ_16235 [Marinibaculum pumilum]|uniref:Large polyvalent protein associated domain-containing protein n=1 Tax=Marinibaculum pumilum TaxID=1766165 RepID=A0ABV7L2S7_9PROT